MNPLSLLFAAALLPSLATASDYPLGHWARGDGQAKVRLERCGEALCAVNTWIKDPNSDEKAGHRLVMTLKPNGERSFKGTAFDPQRDRSYGMTLSYSGNAMTTRGCILGGLLCKSVSWTRIN